MSQKHTLDIPSDLGDVLILADVFENFRNLCMKPDKHDIDPATRFPGPPQLRVIEEGNYQLDPAHYVSAPQLSWDAMLKACHCKLELITDPAMYLLMDGQMRGGVCMISKRYARANNKYMGKLYNPTLPTKYILYLDANNLYGWAMSQPLPHSGLTWILEDEWKGIDWLALSEDSPVGYILEVDLQYPQQLHDLHNDYPLAPERVDVQYEMVSAKQVEISRHYVRARAQTNIKLLPNLMHKSKYCVHYLNLKFYLQHGLVLGKIHRVVRFMQSRWLAPYILKNSRLRIAATNEFEKEFFKLMNNSIYGKTCENQRKRSDFRLVTDAHVAQKLADKPHCLDVRPFADNLVGFQLKKVHLEINKPFYVGFCVLDLSKLHMYRYADPTRKSASYPT